MDIRFVATQFAVTEEDGVLTTFFGNRTDQSDFYLLLQRADNPEERDISLGMDKPYIEYSSQK